MRWWWVFVVACHYGPGPKFDAAPPDAAVIPPGRTQSAYVKSTQPMMHDGFGADIALSTDGTTLAVKANSGVEVFRRSGSAWMFDSRITPIAGSYRMALDGDGSRIALTVIGAALFIYKRSGTSWIEEVKYPFQSPPPTPTYGIGVAFARDGQTIIVGDDGIVHMYVYQAGWAQFGTQSVAPVRYARELALSADGSTLAVGAPGDSTDVPNGGAAYVFTRFGSSLTLQARVASAFPAADDEFGQAVTLDDSGDTLAVGTFRESGNTTENDETSPTSGAVYVFTRTDKVWSAPVYLKAFNHGASDMFGSSVALSGDGKRLVIGATGEPSATIDPEDESRAGAGAAYVLDYTTYWEPTEYLKASSSDLYDSFGYPVVISRDGRAIAVGALREESNSVDDPADNSLQGAGAVYVYH